MSITKTGLVTSNNFIELPNGYTRVDYIQGNGTQWINTNYNYNSENITYEVECDFECVSSQLVTYPGIYGAYESESHKTWRLIRGGSDSQFIVQSNGSPYSGTIYISVGTINQRFRVYHCYDYITWNGNTTSTSSNHSGTTSNTMKFLVFACNNNSPADRSSKMKLYYFALKDNGMYVRYLIPCVRNSDSKVGAFDVCTGTFYTNSGSGDFTYGSLITAKTSIYSDKIISNSFMEI